MVLGPFTQAKLKRFGHLTVGRDWVIELRPYLQWQTVVGCQTVLRTRAQGGTSGQEVDWTRFSDRDEHFKFETKIVPSTCCPTMFSTPVIRGLMSVLLPLSRFNTTVY